jgi:hypothetical protein
MDAKKFGGDDALVIDVCRRHGTWLDVSELQSIVRLASRRKAPDVSPSPIMPAAIAAGAAITAASTVVTAQTQDRSTLERAGEFGEFVLDLVDFLPDLDLGDVVDIVGGIVEIGISLFDGL